MLLLVGCDSVTEPVTPGVSPDLTLPVTTHLPTSPPAGGVSATHLPSLRLSPPASTPLPPKQGVAHSGADIFMQTSERPGMSLTYEYQFPNCTLYNDGELIYRIDTPDHKHIYRHRLLTPEIVQQLRTLVLTDVRFFDLQQPNEIGTQPPDQGYSSITVWVGDQESTLSFLTVYGNGYPTATRFAAQLKRVGSALSAQMIENAPTYAPAGVLIYAGASTSYSLVTPAAIIKPWPITTIDLGAVATTLNLHLQGSEAAQALEAAGSYGFFTQNGTVYEVLAVGELP